MDDNSTIQASTCTCSVISTDRGGVKPPHRMPGFKPIAHKTVSFIVLGTLILGLIGALEYSVRVLPQVSFEDVAQDVASQFGATTTNTSTYGFTNLRREALRTAVDDSTPTTLTAAPTQTHRPSKSYTANFATKVSDLRRRSLSTDETSEHHGQSKVSEARSVTSHDNGSEKTKTQSAPGLGFGDGGASSVAYPDPGLYGGSSATTFIVLKRVAAPNETSSQSQASAQNQDIPDGIPSSHPHYKPSASQLPENETTRTKIADILHTGLAAGSGVLAHAGYDDYKALTETIFGGRKRVASPTESVSQSQALTQDQAISKSILSSTANCKPPASRLSENANNKIVRRSIPTDTQSSLTKVRSLVKRDTSKRSGSNISPKWVKDQPNYFLGFYAPTLLAITLRLLVDYFYRYTNLLSPFNILTRPRGVLLNNFFSAKHLATDLIQTPLLAIRTRNWRLLCAYGLYVLTQLITLFASELISIRIGEEEFGVGEGSEIIEAYALYINLVIVRIIQGLLIFGLALLISLWYLIRREGIVLPGNPASISTLASLVGESGTGSDILFASQSNPKAIESIFSTRRYRLKCYNDLLGNDCYGIVPVRSLPDDIDESGSTKQDSEQDHLRVSSLSSSMMSPFQEDVKFRVGRRKDATSLALIAIATITLFGIILAYTINTDLTPFEEFMDSQAFGPRFVLLVLGLILQLSLLPLAAQSVTEVPFARLMARPRSGKLDILAPVPLTPLGSIGYAFRRREWFVGCLAIAAGILIELLLVLLPGIPFQTDQIYEVACMSWYGSLCCLGLILMIVIFGYLRLIFRPKAAHWPRLPMTVGAVASYVTKTPFAAEFAAQSPLLANNTKFCFEEKNGRWVIDYTQTQP